MLQARPSRRWFSLDREILSNGELLTTVRFGWVREVGSFEFDGESFRIARETSLGAFVLTGASGVACRARQIAYSRRFEVDVDGQKVTLAPRSLFSRGFVLKKAGVIVGDIQRTWFTGKATIDLPEDLPQTVQIFLYWLATIMWRRSG